MAFLLDELKDWSQAKAQHKKLTESVDAAGQVTKSLVNNGSPFDSWRIVNTVNESDKNSQFVNNELGEIYCRWSDVSALGIKRGDKINISNIDYDVIGVDSVYTGIEDILIIMYRGFYGQ